MADYSRLASYRVRPGVTSPDWAGVSSPQAREALLAILEAIGIESMWRDYTPAEDAVRRTILEIYRELGHAPSREEIAGRSGMARERVRALLDQLAGRDLVVLEGDQIVGAYPLTGRPTEHRVRVEGQRLHAMCAIDALGVGAMYGATTLIESRCRLCRVAIAITTVDHGRRLDTVLPGETTVFAGIGYQGGCAATSLCTTIAFFCGDAHLSEWRLAQPLDASGFRLSIDEAFEVGRAVFGPVLAPPALQGQPEPTA